MFRGISTNSLIKRVDFNRLDKIEEISRFNFLVDEKSYAGKYVFLAESFRGEDIAPVLSTEKQGIMTN